jgi:hypothetical protein
VVRFLSIERLLEELGSLDLEDIHWVTLGNRWEVAARARSLLRDALYGQPTWSLRSFKPGAKCFANFTASGVIQRRLFQPVESEKAVDFLTFSTAQWVRADAPCSQRLTISPTAF